VAANPATHFSVSAPAATTAGTAFSFTVTALDQFNNPATGYSGTVRFTSTDGGSVVPPNYTFMVADNGVHTFTATLVTTGIQTITATDTVTSSITGTSASITVTVAAAPTATLSASQTSIALGGSSILTWSSTNANTCTGTNFSTGPGDPTSGTATVSPTSTTMYSVSCMGTGGMGTAAVTVAVTEIPFSAFNARLQVGVSKNPAQDTFALESSFTLPSNPHAPPINPSTGTVMLSIGGYSVTFPPFQPRPLGTYTFNGVINGVKLVAAIAQTGTMRYAFTAGALGNLSAIPTTNTNQQVSVTLTIGSYSGTTNVKPTIVHY
jgi:hypothetical protein